MHRLMDASVRPMPTIRALLTIVAAVAQKTVWKGKKAQLKPSPPPSNNTASTYAQRCYAAQAHLSGFSRTTTSPQGFGAPP